MYPHDSDYNSPDWRRQWQAWKDTGVETVLFEGHTLLEYTYGPPGEQLSTGDDIIDWRPNEPFEATLTIRELERGRSAARFWFEDEENKIRYPFFGQTLVDMLSVSEMKNGKVRGKWIVVKKGANYGIELYQQ